MQKYTLFQNLQMQTKEEPFIGCVNDLLASLKRDNGKYYRHQKANIPYGTISMLEIAISI